MSEARLWQAMTAVLFIGWMVFAVAFVVRKRPLRSMEKKRFGASLGAMLLQGAGLGLSWSLRRPSNTPIFPAPMPVQLALAVVVTVLVASGAWMINAAVSTLGKQWALAARVLEDHKLVMEGPYRMVRHPIYCALFMMLIATALVVGTWPALVAGSVVYLLGTWWRVGLEEKLMIETFGSEYLEYKRKVPALIPWKKPA